MSETVGATSSTAAEVQRENKACSTQHRKAAEILLATPEGEAIVTFCPYAGKPGRPRPENNHNKEVSHAILSGTVLWLVCPFVNNFIARIERSGGVKAIDARLKTDSFLGPLQEASHRVYESYVTQTLLKDPEEQDRFLKMFVLVDKEEEVSGHKKGNYNRKYGNAGVSAPRDLKCFHAVAAQALGGAANPIGCVVVLYLFFLFDLLAEMEEAERLAQPSEGGSGAEDEEDKNEKGDSNNSNTNVQERHQEEGVTDREATAAMAAAGKGNSSSTRERGEKSSSKEDKEETPKVADPGAPSRRVFAAKKTAFAAYVDDFSNFEKFLDDCIANHRLTIDDVTAAKLPQLTAMAKKMLHALEGHQPYQRKKRRIH